MIKGKNILLGVSSSVACYKAVELARLFRKAGCCVRVVMTQNATNLVQPLQFEAATGQPVYCDVFNRRAPWEVEHVSLAHWADVYIIAPATANLMAKMAGGIADDAPTTLYLAFSKPVFLAPAMHTEMWQHPATQNNLEVLKKHGVHIIGPESGDLASGDKGIGRMSEPQVIFNTIVNYFKTSQSLQNKKVLITAGPTREMIDPIRFISNRSSGKMGYALAEEAAERGAQVVLVSGPTSLPDPSNVKTVRVLSAVEMHKEVSNLAPDMDIFIFAAAVGDYRPASIAKTKIKKQADEITLNLVRNPDIAKEIGRYAHQNQTLIGFAAETDNLEEYARNKLREKKFDMIIANDVSSEDIGMGGDHNKVSFIFAKGKIETAGPACKRELAVTIWDKIEKIIKTKKER